MALSFIQGRYLPNPATCISCGSTGKDSIDTGRSEPMSGAILICVECYKWAALNFIQLGLMSSLDHEIQLNQVQESLDRGARIDPAFDQLATDFDIILSRARDRVSASSRPDINDVSLQLTAGTELTDIRSTVRIREEPVQQVLFSVRELLEVAPNQ